MTVQVTALPMEGRLYLCSCFNVWTQPLTAAMLPVDIPAVGDCTRVVYEPAANSPRSGDVDVAGMAFDSFRFRAKDVKGAVSREATVAITVGRCRFTASKPVLKARLHSALEIIM